MTIILKVEQGAEGKQTLEPEKAHSTGDFVIVAKFGDHVLRRLASSLSNVIRQVGRQTKILTFLEFSIWDLVTIGCFKCYVRFW